MKKNYSFLVFIVFVIMCAIIAKLYPIIIIVGVGAVVGFVIYKFKQKRSEQKNITSNSSAIDREGSARQSDYSAKINRLLLTDFVVFDLETTGLKSYADEIIQIGALKIRNSKIVDKFDCYVKPNVPISDYITSLTHISNAMVELADRIEDVLPKFRDFISDYTLVAHNADFDISFLNEAYRKVFNSPVMNTYIDTLEISRAVFPDSPNHKLRTLISYLHLNAQNTHNAVDDCYGVYYLFLAENRELVLINRPIERYYRKNSNLRISDLKPQNDFIDENNPFYKKACVIYGNIDKWDSAQKVINLGGIVRTAASSKTNYFIVSDFSVLDGQSSQIEKLKSAQNRGAEIKIIEYSEFLSIYNQFYHISE